MSKPKYIQESEPVGAVAWEDWAQESTGNYWVKLPEGEWSLVGNLRKDNLGHLTPSGGVVEAEITGAHGHAPLSSANILDALRVEGVDVVTVAELGPWAERIIAEVNAIINLQKSGSTGTTGTTPPGETLLGMLGWTQGVIAVKHGKIFDFRAPSGDGVPSDMRPTFYGTSDRADWSNCTVIAWPIALAHPTRGGSFPSSDAFVPDAYTDTWNMDYPTGIWMKWESNTRIKVNAFEQSAQGSTALAIGYCIIGRR